MQENFHLYVVVTLHLCFAAAIYLWRGNEKFSRLFAISWLIEALRATILFPEVHLLGNRFYNEWFALAEILNFFSTAILLASGAALMNQRIERRWYVLYVVLSIPAVLLSRYFGMAWLRDSFAFSPDDAHLYAVLFNLVVMFVPTTLARSVFAWWLYKTWKNGQDPGAFIALVFAIAYAVIALCVPVQFYFSWDPVWMKYLWCARIFGFSMGILMMIVGRSEQELHDANRSLKTALDQLEIAQRRTIGQERLKALGQMAAGVAHDINNALTPLMNYTDLLNAHAELPEEAREWTNLIQLGVEDAADTVRRLNHFYREPHNREFLESLDLVEIVEQTVQLTKPKWQDQAHTTRQQIEVKTIVRARPQVRGEASQLRSVLTNLIFNSCEAISQRGTIQLIVESVDENAVVTVIDSGSGMAPEQLERCLEPFYSSKSQGSGLGLSECHGIVRQHGGMLNIESTMGQTSVRFSLPLDNHPAPDKTNGDKPRRMTQSQHPRILCIEDNQMIARSTVALLSQLPADVECADDGPTGLSLISEETYDLVLCDQGLPGMDGIEVLARIKSKWPELPVVMVSGWTLPDITEGPQPDAFIGKPYESSELCSTIEKLLHRAKNS